MEILSKVYNRHPPKQHDDMYAEHLSLQYP